MRFPLLLASVAALATGVVALFLMSPAACACVPAAESHFLDLTLEASPVSHGYHFYSEATNRGEGTFLPPNGAWSATLLLRDADGDVVHEASTRSDRVVRFEPGEAIVVLDTFWDFTDPHPVPSGTYEAELTLDAGVVRTARATIGI